MITDSLKREYVYSRHYSDGRLVKAQDALRSARKRIELGKEAARYASTASLWPAKHAARGGEPWTIGGNGPTVAWFEKPQSFARYAGAVADIAKSQDWYGRDWQITGYYTDSDMCSEITKPVVYQLPSHKGKLRFLAGGSDPNNDGPAYLAPTIFDDLRAACSHAQFCASEYGESESRYQESWRKGSDAANIKREYETIRSETRDLCSELRGLRNIQGAPAFIVQSAPKACAALRELIAENWAESRRLLKKIERLRRDAYHEDAFNEGMCT